LPWHDWTKTESIVDKRARLDQGTLVVAFNGFSTSTYISQIGDPVNLNQRFSRQDFVDNLQLAKGQIYDDGLSEIWR
jgi:hypothetical protein